MSTKSNDQGRAYEYMWINALYDALKIVRDTRIIENSSFEANKRAWKLISEEMREIFKNSIVAAIEIILEMEPKLIENENDELLLEFQNDKKGNRGDVRDIVIKRDNINWEIGLSIKHNHEAVKHSRIGNKLDFGKEWYGLPCSKTYWNSVKPIFDLLIEEKKKGTKWSDFKDKKVRIYKPLLDSFIKEIKKVCKNKDIPEKMMEYLIGAQDYYKIISNDKKQITIIKTFNIHGSLNKPSRVKVSAISVPIVELPDELVKIRFKPQSNTTVELYFNKGWQISFRLHNASTYMEPSLKFDIQFIGTPASIINFECKWK